MILRVVNADRFLVRGVNSLSVPGQNEKDIWVDPRTGHEYIAKKAGRNGRMETLTEYLLNVIGLRIGLKVAEPLIAVREGELRFMSKKFHSQDELLQHGHEFLAQFYSDREIACIQRNSREERTLYSISNVITGLEAAYLETADRFVRPFVKMLFFDALVGCQDRHFKNWGIIRSVKGDRQDHFAPIFDTARGLFWEYSTARLREFSETESERYTRRSRPPIGDFQGKRVTHFALVEQIVRRYPTYRPILQQMVSLRKEKAVLELLEEPVATHLPKRRRWQIKHCLQKRFVTLRQIGASNS
jgi:hypothetical protein